MDILNEKSYSEFVFDNNNIKIYAIRKNERFDVIFKNKNTNIEIDRCILTLEKLYEKIKDYPVCFIDGYFYNIIEKKFE